MHPGLAEPRTKEDWRAYLDYQPPPKPTLPSLGRYQAMSDVERARFDAARSRHHSALVLAWTPPVRRFEREILDLLAANECAPAGARPGLLIDGPATVGKSTLVKMIARKYELQLRVQYPERFTDRVDDYVPVVYLSVPDSVTPKQISLALARYLNVPAKGTKDCIDDLILKALRRCGTQLIVIDDLHFLDCAYKEGRASNDHVKYLANHAACTIVGTGVDLTTSPLLTEGSGTTRHTQTAGRFAHHQLCRFAITSAEQRSEWVAVVKTLEDALILFQHQPYSLARTHWRYLHERTGGSIAALHLLIRLAAIRALGTGAEAVTRDLLDTISLSFSSQRDYATIVNARSGRGRRGASGYPDAAEPPGLADAG
ncbi:MAG TPA: TniB family NTP-binding protein [Pseudonocardiaceae bacterium]|nr:TniB family NTP-binding protein [Pseudonocardiaceae bacterium]